MEGSQKRLIPIGLTDWQAHLVERPITQFVNVGLIADDVTKQAIEQHCEERGYHAGIDYDPQPGVACYVWHSLIERATNRHWEFSIDRRIRGRPPRELSTEQKLLIKILNVLEAHHIAVDTEVACAAGRADIVTQQRDIIYELKGHLWRMPLLLAVAQVLLYRASINPTARVAIIGYETSETAALLPVIESLGIRVILWKD